MPVGEEFVTGLCKTKAKWLQKLEFFSQTHRVCFSVENPTVGPGIGFTIQRMFVPLGWYKNLNFFFIIVRIFRPKKQNNKNFIKFFSKKHEIFSIISF